MFIFHNIWHNPSHWLSYFQRGGSTTNQTKSAVFSGLFSILRIPSIHISEAMLNAKILSDAPDAGSGGLYGAGGTRTGQSEWQKTWDKMGKSES